MEIIADSREMIALMVTRKCNMTCAHCSVASSPSLPDGPSDADLTRIVEQTIAAGVGMIQFTGGEPMLRETLVLRLMEMASENQVASAMTSNGFWGEDEKGAEETLKALRQAGMIQLTISYDPFHEAFLPVQSVKNIAQAAEKQNFSIQVNLTRLKDDRNLDGIVESLRGFKSVQLRFYDVQPVGRAKRFDAEALRENCEGFCNACERAAISDDGRLMACNGPGYFSKPDSSLIVGSLADHSLAELLDQHAADPILQTIRTLGPNYLKTELAKLPEGRGFPFRDSYNGMCDLCLHLTSDAEAMTALSRHLSSPRELAKRESHRLLIAKQRMSGEFNRTYVNTIGIAKILLDAALPGQLEGVDDRFRKHILSRVDLDWQKVVEQVTKNGLARPLLPFFQSITKFAPAFAVETIRRSAVAESLKMVQVETMLRTIGETLNELKIENAILLKGGALVIQSLSDGESIPAKTPGDIDLFVPPDKTDQLWNALREKGFDGTPGAADDNHLQPLFFRNITLEIHHRIMPEFWGLPEDVMIEDAVTVAGWEPFKILSIEGFLLHTCVHLACENYTHGLKTLWGNLYAIQRQGIDQIDWELLRNWAAISSAPRAIWVPMQLSHQQLSFPLPAEFIDRAPTDRRQDWLIAHATGRIYTIFNHKESSSLLRRFPHRLLLSRNFATQLHIVWLEMGPAAQLSRLQHMNEIGWGDYFRLQQKLAGGFWRIGRRIIGRCWRLLPGISK